LLYDILKLAKLLGVYIQPGDDTALLEQFKNNRPAYPSGGAGYNSQSFVRHLFRS